MKRIFALILALILILGLGSCSAPKNQKPVIVCTLFAHYDWARNILGEEADRFELVLLGNGADLHSYEASANDLALLGRCDLLIYNGGSSEQWVEDAITQAGVKNTLNIGAQSELLALPHEHTAEEHHHEYDEHTWLSLKRAPQSVIMIGRAIIALDPAHRETYATNTTAYVKKLQAMDRQYTQTVQKAARKTLLFADRFPFRYLVADYDMTYFAAFDGCSAETEASASTVAMLAVAIDQLGLNTVLILEHSEEDLAHTVIESAKTEGLQILRLHSMQAMDAEEVQNSTYLSITESNLKIIEKALN